MINYRMNIVIFMFLMLCGCDEKINNNMLVGNYYANHKKGIDTLEIKTDGTYNYSYKSNDGKEYINSNVWHFEYVNNDPRVTFDKFIFYLPGYKSNLPGFWDVKVEVVGRTLRLCIDPDLDYYYEKRL